MTHKDWCVVEQEQTNKQVRHQPSIYCSDIYINLTGATHIDMPRGKYLSSVNRTARKMSIISSTVYILLLMYFRYHGNRWGWLASCTERETKIIYIKLLLNFIYTIWFVIVFFISPGSETTGSELTGNSMRLPWVERLRAGNACWATGLSSSHVVCIMRENITEHMYLARMPV